MIIFKMSSNRESEQNKTKKKFKMKIESYALLHDSNACFFLLLTSLCYLRVVLLFHIQI